MFTVTCDDNLASQPYYLCVLAFVRLASHDSRIMILSKMWAKEVTFHQTYVIISENVAHSLFYKSVATLKSL